VSLPEVSGAHFRAVANKVSVAGGDLDAVDHHGDHVGNAEHRIHVVFHQQNGVVGAQRVEQLEHALGFLGAHAGQRLVEQQHLGFGGQAHGDLELAFLAV
jgi:hypothetical protein